MLRPLFSCFALALAFAAPLTARALDREYVLKFLPSSGTVSGYRVYLASTGLPMQTLDLRAVTADPDGVAREALQLEATRAFTVSMTAYNAAGESTRSNQINVPASTCDPAACDDRDPCTADDCQNLTCIHTRLPDGSTCGSGSVCLSGSCRVPQCTSDAQCADGDACDGAERCAGFSCVGGTAPVCPQPGPCQQGGCSASAGCVLSNRADGTACDDANPATSGDQCRSGTCTGTAFSGCRSDAECSDGDLCNGGERCMSDGRCTSGTALVCGGATQCATPICRASGGCGMTPRADGTTCDDGVATTTGDRCVAGLCQGTTPDTNPTPNPTPERLSLVSITPGRVRGLGLYRLALSGSGFAPGLKVSFAATNMLRVPYVYFAKVTSAERIDLQIWNPPRNYDRVWDVVVTLPDGQKAVLPAAFRTDR
jgi:hypothetical protein